MCVAILVIHGDEKIICETVEELAEALKLRPIEVSPDPKDNCLCGARIDQLGARPATENDYGYPWTNWVIER